MTNTLVENLIKATESKTTYRLGCHHLRYFRRDAYPTSIERVFSTIYTSFDRAGRALVDMEKLVDREQPNDVYTFFIREEKETV